MLTGAVKVMTDAWLLSDATTFVGALGMALKNELGLPIPYKLAVVVGNATEEAVAVKGLLPVTAPKTDCV